MISDESNVPDCYIQEVQDFLSKNDKNESISNISGIEDLPRE